MTFLLSLWGSTRDTSGKVSRSSANSTATTTAMGAT